MAEWYASSAAHAAVPVFAINTAYTVGQFVRRITATPKAQWVMRCTVAGTSAASEPTWPTANNGTVVSGGATFANVTGQSAYAWAAAAGDIPTLLGAVGTQRFAAGDRMFVSSDHAETQTANTSYGMGSASASYTPGQVLSVNRAGSVPPVAADLTPGASCTVSGGNLSIIADWPVYHYGMNYICTGTTGISLGGWKTSYFDSCQLYLNNAAASLARIYASSAVTVVLSNSIVNFTHVSQAINTNGGPMDLTWLNGGIGAGSTIPTFLFLGSASFVQMLLATVRGVDLSPITTTLVFNATTGTKYLFDSCRIASGVARLSLTSVNNTRDLVELINCYDGTNIINESYQPSGSVVTERTITLSGGATDDVGTFSHKLVSGTNIDKYVNPLLGFWMDVEYQTTGSSKTATVELISSASLNNDEISLLLEYQGTSGSSVASFGTTLPATVLTTAAAVTTSTATWNSSPASTWNSSDLSAITLSGSNLIATSTGSGAGVRGVQGLSSGKYYWEYTINTFTNNSSNVGIASASAALSTVAAAPIQAALMFRTGVIWINGSNTGSSLGTRANGNVIAIALDVVAQLIWFRVAPSGNWNGSGGADPATGSGGLSISGLTGGLYPLFSAAAGSESATANFGATSFSGAVPSGFTSGLSPVKQKLQVTFTPQLAGRVRGQVRLGKASTTCYVDPVITIT